MGLPVYRMEVDLVTAAADLRAIGRDENAERVDKFMGLRAFSEQLLDLQIGDLTCMLDCMLVWTII